MLNVSYLILFSYTNQDVLIIVTGISRLFKHMEPNFIVDWVCKIPSTWKGLQACRMLESSGIRTLATTLFTLEQAVLAGEVGCHYVAPYVNELKVHVTPE